VKQIEVFITDKNGRTEPIEWTSIQDIVKIIAKNVTPRHAIKLEYNDDVYYGVADDNGIAELSIK